MAADFAGPRHGYPRDPASRRIPRAPDRSQTLSGSRTEPSSKPAPVQIDGIEIALDANARRQAAARAFG
jgi:hypothetical protein